MELTGEQTGLKRGSTLHDGKAIGETHGGQGVEIFVVVLRHLPLVHGVEVKFGVVITQLADSRSVYQCKREW